MPCKPENRIHYVYANPSAAPIFLCGKNSEWHLAGKRRAGALSMKEAVSPLITYLFEVG